MAAAYLVAYRGPTGECPDAVVCFEGGAGENIAVLAPKAQRCLARYRGNNWNERDVQISSMQYLGPWFMSDPIKDRPKE
jgi:hypothetical protein